MSCKCLVDKVGHIDCQRVAVTDHCLHSVWYRLVPAGGCPFTETQFNVRFIHMSSRCGDCVARMQSNPVKRTENQLSCMLLEVSEAGVVSTNTMGCSFLMTRFG